MMLQDKHIVILGAGISGKGAARFAKSLGASVFVSDSKAIDQDTKLVFDKHQILYEEGSHDLKRIAQADIIIKSPGIPFQSAFIKSIEKLGIPIIDEIELLGQYTNDYTICISGSNGKTTTAIMTTDLVKAVLNKNKPSIPVDLVGNIGLSYGESKVDNNYSHHVIELSSFQIEGMSSFKPHIYILTNITPDHLDRYENNFDTYAKVKWSLTKQMDPDALLIVNAEDKKLMTLLATYPPICRVLLFSLTDHNCDAYLNEEQLLISNHGETLHFPIKNLPKGNHQLLNAMASLLAALEVAKHYSISVDANLLQQVLENFEAIPHRMQYCGKFKGMSFYNDSKATNVESTQFALQTFAKNIIWIVGGYDKGNDYASLIPIAQEKVKQIICLGIDNEKIKKAFEGVSIFETQSMIEALNHAVNNGASGDVVLLSPACASFDLFKNYEDRGNQFINVLQQISENKKVSQS